MSVNAIIKAAMDQMEARLPGGSYVTICVFSPGEDAILWETILRVNTEHPRPILAKVRDMIDEALIMPSEEELAEGGGLQ